jgi:hypothetical protein
MARILNIPKWTGTRKGLTVYQLNGKFYLREKSSLSGERVRTSKAFAKTRQHADILARASQLASQAYAALPGEYRIFRNYRLLTGKAIKLIKFGWPDEKISNKLLDPDCWENNLILRSEATWISPKI